MRDWLAPIGDNAKRRTPDVDARIMLTKFAKEAIHDRVDAGEFAENAIRKDFLPSEIDAIRRAMEPEVATPVGRPRKETGETFTSSSDKRAPRTSDKIGLPVMAETGHVLLGRRSQAQKKSPASDGASRRRAGACLRPDARRPLVGS